MCPWQWSCKGPPGEQGRAPHSASCTACPPACPSSPGSGPRPWLQCLHAAWRQFSPPTPCLVSMATPVEITLKRNETSSFSVWQVGGGELSWERLGKGFEVWRKGAVGQMNSHMGSQCWGQQGWGNAGTSPTVALGVGSPGWYGASSHVCCTGGPAPCHGGVIPGSSCCLCGVGARVMRTSTGHPTQPASPRALHAPRRGKTHRY